MRFAYDPYAISISLNEGDTCILYVENSNAYSNIVSDLYMLISHGEGEAALYEGDISLDIKKSTDLILEPFSLDLNNRKIKSQLYQDIIENVKDAYYDKYLNICNELHNFIGCITEGIHYSTAFECQVGLEELLKICNVSMDYPCENVMERVSVYIKLMARVCKIKVFFLVDVDRYANCTELREIVKMAQYEKINLIMICSGTKTIEIKDFSHYILDESLCFWKAE
ncbi:type II-A CRISPR-associated protein Csn2 [bacterium]|nr:type II-A CRISPR-associated protein Csn2 [bacterium]MBP3819182.1 type II-A CRISPR-associated protein Csn2 [Butyrivibrio sp.]